MEAASCCSSRADGYESGLRALHKRMKGTMGKVMAGLFFGDISIVDLIPLWMFCVYCDVNSQSPIAPAFKPPHVYSDTYFRL